MIAPEFDGQPMTKREIGIARSAVSRAISDQWDSITRGSIGAWEGTARIAARLYPLPKVTRPRVVLDPHDSGTTPIAWHWKVEGRAVVICDADGAVIDPPCKPMISRERVALWSDLLARPTEEVEA